MANIYNYGLLGASSDFQLGKGGVRLSGGSGALALVKADGFTPEQITAAQFNGSGAGLSATTVSNNSLVNSKVTIGSTDVILGATVATFAGLTSVTSAAFVGPLTGNSDTATLATTATNLGGGVAGALVYQTATGTTGYSAAGTAGQVSLSGGTGAPTWTTPASANTANSLVIRDANGDFSAGTITVTGDATHSGLTLNGTVTQATDAATKAYVDAVAQGLAWKQPVRLATAGPIALDGTQVNVDGVAVATGNRVLVKNQASNVENGIYIASTVAAWTRTADGDTPNELNDAAVFVQAGDTLTATAWVQTAVVATIGVSAITFAQFSAAGAYVAGAGLTLTGNSFAAKVDSTTLFVDAANSLAVNSTATAGQVLRSGGVAGTAATWGAVDLANTSAVTGILAAPNGGTGHASYTVGDMLFADTTTTLAAVSGVATGNALLSGGVGAAPAYGKIGLTTHVTGTLAVGNGGTGATTFNTNSVLVGNGTGAVTAPAALTFVTDTLTVGTATLTGSATDTVLMATATNGNITLVPNGTGKVLIGPAATDGSIGSEAGQALTITGATTLTLASGAGGVIVALATGDVAAISGPSAAAYSTLVAAGAGNTIPNKQYVLDVVAGSAPVLTNMIEAFTATVSLAADGTVALGTLPAGCDVLSVKVLVTVADTAATLSVGVTGSPAKYMSNNESNPQVTGMYIAEVFGFEATAVALFATVASSAATAGATCRVIVQYKIA